MARGFFVTGTDTGVGKTLISVALLQHLSRQGLRAVGMKPVAAGAEPGPTGLLNEDAAALRAASSVEVPLELVNPYVFAPPIAPHIAAQQAGVRIDLARIETCFDALAAGADSVVVEGAGGLLVPLNETQTLADLAVRLRLPLVLVVGMRLGCLNHALLTVEAIERRGLTLAGWVANHVDADMAYFDANLATLIQRIPAPLLAAVPRLSAPEKTMLVEWVVPPMSLM